MKEQTDRMAYVPRNKRDSLSKRMNKRDHRLGAYPEMISEGPWEVLDIAAFEKGTPGFDRAQRKLLVPVGHNAEEQEVRAQEMTKIKISPEHVPADINPVIMNAVEDLRVHSYMRRKVGLNKAFGDMDAETRDHIRMTVDKMTGRIISCLADHQLLLALSAIDSLWEASVLGAVDPDVREAAHTVRDALWELSKGTLDFQTAYDIARELQNQLADFRDYADQEEYKLVLNFRGLYQGAHSGDEAPNDGGPKSASMTVDPDTIKVGTVHFPPPRPYKISQEALFELYSAMEGRTGVRPALVGETAPQASNGYRWLPIKIHVPELSQPALPPDHAKMKRRWQGTAKGSIPTHMHRYAIDRYVFGKKQKSKAGISVLVDVSGSMSLTAASLVRILTEVPAATVARYNARPGHGSVESGGHGDLVILAQNGRRVADNLVGEGSGGYNACDLPALEWLARQPGTLYWLSDGGVTGEGDTPSYTNSKQVWTFVNQHDIYQVTSVTQLINVLKGKIDLPPLDILGLSPDSKEWGSTYYYSEAAKDPDLQVDVDAFPAEV